MGVQGRVGSMLIPTPPIGSLVAEEGLRCAVIPLRLNSVQLGLEARRSLDGPRRSLARGLDRLASEFLSQVLRSRPSARQRGASARREETNARRHEVVGDRESTRRGCPPILSKIHETRIIADLTKIHEMRTSADRLGFTRRGSPRIDTNNVATASRPIRDDEHKRMAGGWT
jgi:hypothetical protein